MASNLDLLSAPQSFLRRRGRQESAVALGELIGPVSEYVFSLHPCQGLAAVDVASHNCRAQIMSVLDYGLNQRLACGTPLSEQLAGDWLGFFGSKQCVPSRRFHP